MDEGQKREAGQRSEEGRGKVVKVWEREEKRREGKVRRIGKKGRAGKGKE